jgi:hypothetical protein
MLYLLGPSSRLPLPNRHPKLAAVRIVFIVLFLQSTVLAPLSASSTEEMHTVLATCAAAMAKSAYYSRHTWSIRSWRNSKSRHALLNATCWSQYYLLPQCAVDIRFAARSMKPITWLVRLAHNFRTLWEIEAWKIEDYFLSRMR